MKKSKLSSIQLLVSALLLFCTSGIAQRKVSGVVEDAKTNAPSRRERLMTVKGIKRNTISKEGGKFELTVPMEKFRRWYLCRFPGQERCQLKQTNLIF